MLQKQGVVIVKMC